MYICICTKYRKHTNIQLNFVVIHAKHNLYIDEQFHTCFFTSLRSFTFAWYRFFVFLCLVSTHFRPIVFLIIEKNNADPAFSSKLWLMNAILHQEMLIESKKRNLAVTNLEHRSILEQNLQIYIQVGKKASIKKLNFWNVQLYQSNSSKIKFWNGQIS